MSSKRHPEEFKIEAAKQAVKLGYPMAEVARRLCITTHSLIFDSDFLEAVSQVPIDECMYHRINVKWIDCFGNEVSAVPWQSYPGNVPCPVEDDQAFGYQFGTSYSTEWSRAKLAIRIKKAKEKGYEYFRHWQVVNRQETI